jgi:hypothetical protein
VDTPGGELGKSLLERVRAFRLLNSIPEYFRKRQWNSMSDRTDIAVLAAACVSLGAFGQKIRVPIEWCDDKEWQFAGDGKVTALDILVHLELAPFIQADARDRG